MKEEDAEKQVSEELTPVEPSAQPEPAPTNDAPDLIALANKAAERLEAANKNTEALIKQAAQAQVQRTLAGQATAGVPVLSDEEKKEQRAKEFLKGTGFEDDLFPEE